MELDPLDGSSDYLSNGPKFVWFWQELRMMAHCFLGYYNIFIFIYYVWMFKLNTNTTYTM